MTSYQKLKQQNADLRRKLEQVCLRPDTPETALIIHAMKVAYQKEKMLMYGTSTPPLRGLCGLMHQIQAGYIPLK
jgi:hypothetical protein